MERGEDLTVVSCFRKWKFTTDVLSCITRQVFENTREMKKTRAPGDFLHFSSDLKCPDFFLSQCNTRIRFLQLLYYIEVMWQKTIKHAFSKFYTLIRHGTGFLANQSAHRVLFIL